MSERMTLSFLTKFIKSYNGEKDSLPAFLTNCDNAMSLATPEQQPILCKFIISQLEGKAQVACSLKTFETWNQIKSFLRSTFGEKKHATHLLSDLQNCKQSSEDVTKFSLKLEQILTKIQSDIHYSCKNADELPGRIAAMEDLALNTFLLGLNPAISTIVRCRNPQTLNEAVQLAIEEEKLQNLQTCSKNSIKQCSICNKVGHVATQCFKNKKHSNYNHNKQISHLSSSNSGKLMCNYCKNIGHTIDQCRKRQYNMQQRQNFNHNSNYINRSPNNNSNFISRNPISNSSSNSVPMHMTYDNDDAVDNSNSLN
ncbi:unnamed protein product [Parnassius mnemosyne]|uniref:CCHC-type domain-containing protein n=1 Tax=Parnassius mnemosyne TaxID=213953 RepID=A0AAV1KGQ0_9NEOP